MSKNCEKLIKKVKLFFFKHLILQINLRNKKKDWLVRKK